MTILLAGFALQVACQLIVQKAPILADTNYGFNRSPGATVLKLATLPFQLMCQLIAKSPDVDEEIISALPKGYVAFREDHAAYKFHNELVLWEEASERCKTEGGRLAIIDSNEKIIHISKLTKTPLNKWIHVGIRKSNATDQYVRIDDGAPVPSVPWDSVNIDPTKNCTGIATTGDGLMDYDCDKWREYFVCEIPI